MPPKIETTWLVRFVQDGTLKVRTFQTEEAAQLFMDGAAESGIEIRGWAEVKTRDLPLPKGIREWTLSRPTRPCPPGCPMQSSAG